MNEGFITLHRKMMDWEWYKNPNVFSVFMYCLLMANWKDKKWEGITIKRGSFITSIDGIYNGINRNGRTGKLNRKTQRVTVQNIRTALNKLNSTGELTIKTTPQYTVITVNNYNKYQVTNKGSNKQLTNDQQTTNKQLTTTNKDNKEKKDNNILPKGNTGFGNPDINEVSDYFLKTMKIPKEDCTQKQSRQYWKLLLKESKTGVDGVRWLIDQASEDDYYRNNITSSKDLYYKRVKLISRKRGEHGKSKVAYIS